MCIFIYFIYFRQIIQNRINFTIYHRKKLRITILLFDQGQITLPIKKNNNIYLLVIIVQHYLDRKIICLIYKCVRFLESCLVWQGSLLVNFRIGSGKWNKRSISLPWKTFLVYLSIFFFIMSLFFVNLAKILIDSKIWQYIKQKIKR